MSRNSARPRTRSAGVALTRDRQRIADDKGGDTDAEEDRTIAEIRRKTFHRFTSAGFKEAMRKGKGMLKKIGDGKYVDKNGVILSVDGPFWPQECGPLYPKPDHIKKVPSSAEPLFDKGKNYLILLYFLCPCACVCVFLSLSLYSVHVFKCLYTLTGCVFLCLFFVYTQRKESRCRVCHMQYVDLCFSISTRTL